MQLLYKISATTRCQVCDVSASWDGRAGNERTELSPTDHPSDHVCEHWREHQQAIDLAELSDTGTAQAGPVVGEVHRVALD
ncbi:MAG: hypothetical protein WB507_05920 [Solirubrobacterales bacterium]